MDEGQRGWNYTMKNLIGIVGKARSGKSVFGEMLEAELWQFPADSHENFTCYALASPIKNIINDIFNWDEKHSEGYLKEVDVSIIMPTPEQFEAALKFYLLDFKNHEKVLFKNLFFAKIIDKYTDADAIWGIISSRRAYQIFGTDIARTVRDTIWIDQAKARLDKGKRLILTDVRFENEAKWVREQGGTLIHIERDAAIAVSKHSSEDGVHILEDDIIISNNGTLEKLEWYAKRIAKEIIGVIYDSES